MTLVERLQAIEDVRTSRCILIAVPHLELELLPYLFDVLNDIGETARLDVVLSCRGGMPAAARRIARMVRGFASHVTFVVPERCQSSGTILTLSADEIIAAPSAVFTPVDPLLQGNVAEGTAAPMTIAAEEVRQFAEMAERWFGVASTDASARAMAALSRQLFPTSLTAFYRSTQLVEEVCRELIAMGSIGDVGVREAIVAKLMHGFHAHDYALDGEDLAGLGLPVVRSAPIEEIAVEIARDLRALLGDRHAPMTKEWRDAALFSTDRGMIRMRGEKTVKRRSKGTPDRRRRGTPFSDNMMLVC